MRVGDAVAVAIFQHAKFFMHKNIYIYIFDDNKPRDFTECSATKHTVEHLQVVYMK